MVGFLLGCLFTYTVQHELKKREAVEAPKDPVPTVLTAVPPPAPEQPAAPKPRPSYTDVEAVFAMYHEKAVWENDLTEVALWNSVTGKFSELFEVMRSGDEFYFRSLPGLTRPLIDYDNDPGLPIRFTEPVKTRERRYEHLPAIWRPAPPKL